MPNRKESQEVKPPPKQGAAEQSKSRARIGRACDRCKIKKSRCDGNSPCSACVASESVCEYSARRRREARDWYWGMQDVIDEALQRLYWACREGRGFPGVVPDETNGRVSTDAILRGLGLSPPPVERRPLVGAEGDSIWGSQEELLIRRSYRPPDIHADGLSSVIAGSSRPTPMSMVGDDQVTVGSSHDPTGRGKAGEETRTEGGQESLHMNLGQQSFPAIDSPADPSLLQDGVVGFMDFDPALYQDLHVTEFHGGNQLAGQTQGMSARVVRSQILAQGPQQELLESSEQVEWEVQQEGTVEDMLPWPGNIAALQKGKELEDDRDGIHHHGRKG